MEKSEEKYLPKICVFGTYRYNYHLNVLTVGSSRNIKFTTCENELVNVFFFNLNNIITKKELISTTSLIFPKFSDKSLGVIITRLRKKLHGHEDLQIINIHNVGFKMVYAPLTFKKRLQVRAK